MENMEGSDKDINLEPTYQASYCYRDIYCMQLSAEHSVKNYKNYRESFVTRNHKKSLFNGKFL